ncbi:MAG: hypothetical protein M3Q64_00475 [bacterium]|nr:hypothetical protein [bacterium]
MKQKTIYALIAIAVVAIGAYLYINSGNKAVAPENENTTGSSSSENNITQPTNTNVNTNSPAVLPSKNSIVLSTQSAGTEVLVDNFYFEKPGFIAIREAKGDAIGNVIGFSGWLNSGPGQDLTFKVTLKAGVKYFAEMYEDNGDKKFSATTDKPVADSEVSFSVVK